MCFSRQARNDCACGAVWVGVGSIIAQGASGTRQDTKRGGRSRGAGVGDVHGGEVSIEGVTVCSTGEKQGGGALFIAVKAAGNSEDGVCSWLPWVNILLIFRWRGRALKGAC